MPLHISRKLKTSRLIKNLQNFLFNTQVAESLYKPHALAQHENDGKKKIYIKTPTMPISNQLRNGNYGRTSICPHEFKCILTLILVYGNS
ncbi:Uncharacterized protein TCM_006936 [Theobroma cacao]|uniref:Uncharacterized protein n=1 Tax=Theobroma cacao TaxID=3641 RepID=A0A061DZ96_THECC|nr:Uncharacterized protein TCM_006936 [Theobroma cacao]